MGNTYSDKSYRYHLALALMLCAQATLCYGWSGRAHGQITLDAYRELAVADKALFQSLAERLAREYKNPATTRTSNPSCNAFPSICFLGYWPDTVRDIPFSQLLNNRDKKPLKVLVDGLEDSTASWHYNNVFYDVKSKQLIRGCKNQGKIIAASEALMEAFKESTNRLQQAVILSFLVHLAADAHQPLHALTGVGRGCRHDLGGNKVCLSLKQLNDKQSACELNLHQLWDRGAGIFKQWGSIQTVKQPRHHEVNLSFQKWLDESAQYASQVYSFNNMSDSQYRKQVQTISKKRVKKAVYRIAALIRKLLQKVNNE